MVYTSQTDRSHPERRGFRTLPSFGEVRAFEDLAAHNWPIDPVMEYIMMTQYLAESTELGHPKWTSHVRISYFILLKII